MAKKKKPRGLKKLLEVPQDAFDQPVYTVREVANLVKVPEDSVYRWIKQGKLELVKSKNIEQKLITKESLVRLQTFLRNGGKIRKINDVNATVDSMEFWYPFIRWMVYQVVLYNDNFESSNESLLKWGFPQPPIEHWKYLRGEVLRLAPPTIRRQYVGRAIPNDQTGEYYNWVKELKIDDVYYTPDVLQSDIIKFPHIRLQVELLLHGGHSPEEVADEIYESHGTPISVNEVRMFHKYFCEYSAVDDERYTQYLNSLPLQSERLYKFQLKDQDIEVIRFHMGNVEEAHHSQDAYLQYAAYIAMKAEINEHGTMFDVDRINKLMKLRSDAIKNYHALGGSSNTIDAEFVLTDEENPYIKGDVEENIEDIAGSQELIKQQTETQEMGGRIEEEPEDNS